MVVPITVSIPVGPHPSNTLWLQECLDSIRSQHVRPSEVLIVDDGADLLPIEGVRIYKTPWISGVAHAFNYGVMLASNDLSIMLGSDDVLLWDCIQECWLTWEKYHDPLAYYAMMVKYNNGTEQDIPCNAAMVHKDLWRLTGGFPVQSSIGACDTWLLSLIYAGQGKFGTIRMVSDHPVYWYRQHEETDTAKNGPWWGLVTTARDLYLRQKLGLEESDGH